MKRVPQQATVFYCLLMASMLQMFFSFELGAREYGFMLLCWTLLATYIFTWLVNRYNRLRVRVKRDGAKREALSSQLIYGMHSRQTFDSGVRALKTLNSALALISILFFLYILWGSFLYFGANVMPALLDIQVHITDFYERFVDEPGQDPFFNSFLLEGWINNTLLLLAAGLSFWVSRLLSVASRIGRFLPWFSLGLFLFALIVMLPAMKIAQPYDFDTLTSLGYGWGASQLYDHLSLMPFDSASAFQISLFENGVLGCLFLGALGLSLFALIIRNFFRSSAAVAPTICAAAIYTIMLGVYLFLVSQPDHMLLYIYGLTAIAGLTVQSNLRVRKRHTLYQ